MKKIISFFLLFFFCWCVFAEKRQRSNVGSLSEDLDAMEDENQFLKKVKTLKAKKLSDLIYLSPFDDVSVIQRRFMPKTGRFALSLQPTFVLSSAFFLNPGIEAHLTYHFLEKMGLELTGYYVETFERGVTTDFANIQATVQENLPVPRAFAGLFFKWIPSYGKMVFFNRKIISFDTFFVLGGGTTAIKREKVSIVWEPSGAIGVGQVFAITRDMGFRWDLKWNFTIETQSDINPGNFLSSLVLSIGLNYYVPSAGVR